MIFSRIVTSTIIKQPREIIPLDSSFPSLPPPPSSIPLSFLFLTINESYSVQLFSVVDAEPILFLFYPTVLLLVDCMLNPFRRYNESESLKFSARIRFFFCVGDRLLQKHFKNRKILPLWIHMHIRVFVVNIIYDF